MRLSVLPASLIAAAGLALALATPAAAEGPDGVWLRTDGMAKVRFSPCNEGYCGTIVWLKHPEGPGKIGEQVFFGMGKTSANTFTGSAHNPEDGRDYDGYMTVAGNRLATKGCALGGMICKTQNWTRSR